jgi:uncharacterized protein
MLHRAYLMIEFLLLCVALPTFIIISKNAPFMFAFLWGATLYCFLVLYFQRGLNFPEIWNWKAVRWDSMKMVLLRWVLVTLAMMVFINFYAPEHVLELPKRNPQLLLMLFFLYPVLSALPQEFIFCSFFFRRYRYYFGSGFYMILTSALLFAFAHMLYINPVAPALSFLGGLIFAGDYARHRSLALVTIEHGLYGNSLFFTGLGYYFYSGAVH